MSDQHSISCYTWSDGAGDYLIVNDTIDVIFIKVLGPQICAKLAALAIDESLMQRQ